MEMPREGVASECRCKLSWWSELDSDVLFVWGDLEVLEIKQEVQTNVL